METTQFKLQDWYEFKNRDELNTLLLLFKGHCKKLREERKKLTSPKIDDPDVKFVIVAFKNDESEPGEGDNSRYLTGTADEDTSYKSRGIIIKKGDYFEDENEGGKLIVAFIIQPNELVINNIMQLRYKDGTPHFWDSGTRAWETMIHKDTSESYYLPRNKNGLKTVLYNYINIDMTEVKKN